MAATRLRKIEKTKTVVDEEEARLAKAEEAKKERLKQLNNKIKELQAKNVELRAVVKDVKAKGGLLQTENTALNDKIRKLEAPG